MKIKAITFCLIASTIGALGVNSSFPSPPPKDPVLIAVENAPSKFPEAPSKTVDVQLAKAESLPTGEAKPAQAENTPGSSESLFKVNPAWVDAPFSYDYQMYPYENQKVIDKWHLLGAESGPLGQPWTYLTCSQGGYYCYEEFEWGTLYTSGSSPTAYVMYASPESNTWNSSNPNSLRFTQAPKSFPGAPYGWPVSDPMALGNVSMQQFEQAIIYSSRSTGASQILMRNHPFTSKYLSMGSHNGSLGLPIGNVSCSNVCSQKFQNGEIYNVSTGIVAVEGAIYSAYKAAGSQSGTLGLPLADKVTTSSGTAQSFANGKIYTGSQGTQVFLNSKPMTVKYKALGAEAGSLGYPAGNETCDVSGCYQKFQKGLIYLSTAGDFIVNGVNYTRYTAAGGPTGYLGLPQGNSIVQGSQSIQKFKGGTIGNDTDGTRDYALSECDTLNSGKSKYSASGANRVTFAIAENYGQYQANVINCKKIAGSYLIDWKSYGTVGQSGFARPGEASGPTRFMFSPTGSFSVTEAFGLQNPGTQLPYRILNSSSRWGGNPTDPDYNKYFEASYLYGYDEDMWYFATRPTQDYRNGAVINYNRPPDVAQIIPDAGFAIFLHENPVPTAGCIALDHFNMVRWLQSAKPGDRIMMGVRSDLFNP